MILLIQVPNVVEIRDGWKLYIVAGGVMVRISTALSTYLSRIIIDSLIMAF
jgi:hypothetical protein